mmetsp:Transcript_17654/g.38682  ORF Transcript_17654/g.38682 Transcript_17654/m.38682 type:complete len:389 (-) Transcript_17654:2954-4120(-)
MVGGHTACCMVCLHENGDQHLVAVLSKMFLIFRHEFHDPSNRCLIERHTAAQQFQESRLAPVLGVEGALQEQVIALSQVLHGIPNMPDVADEFHCCLGALGCGALLHLQACQVGALSFCCRHGLLEFLDVLIEDLLRLGSKGPAHPGSLESHSRYVGLHIDARLLDGADVEGSQGVVRMLVIPSHAVRGLPGLDQMLHGPHMHALTGMFRILLHQVEDTPLLGFLFELGGVCCEQSLQPRKAIAVVAEGRSHEVVRSGHTLVQPVDGLADPWKGIEQLVHPGLALDRAQTLHGLELTAGLLRLEQVLVIHLESVIVELARGHAPALHLQLGICHAKGRVVGLNEHLDSLNILRGASSLWFPLLQQPEAGIDGLRLEGNAPRDQILHPG